MNAARIIDVFKRACSPHVKTPLGRWNTHNYSETALKIKYATEDNCGVYYYKNAKQMQEDVELHEDEKYIYMMGYESVHIKH